MIESNFSMNLFKKKPPPVVQAAAPVDAAPQPRKESEAKELVGAMEAEHSAVQSDAEHLEVQRKYQKRLGLLRQGKKDDGMVGNLLSNQEDKVQDAQIALNRSMERLTHKSMQLLVDNTCVIDLHDARQTSMQAQQDALQQQARAMTDQHQKLLEQHDALRQQQKSIQTAHQGLLQAKGITSEHAQRLVGCVVEVTEAGQKLALANLQLRAELEHNVQAAVQQCRDQLGTGFSDMNERLRSFEAESHSMLRTLVQQTTQQLALFKEESDAFETRTQQKLQAHIHAVLDETTVRHAQLLEQRTHDLTSFLQQKTLALDEAMHRVEQAVQQSLQAQSLALTAQRAALESSLQSVAVDLNDNVGAIAALNKSLHSNKDAVSALGHQITTVQAQQHAARRRHRQELALVAFVAVLSLGWQLARHFALG